ncbi:Sirtuin family [Penicillium coprophilum]|uniref:Sirtuin family n=1 Tax=Penicillium coprophilum TaxID=36646 RepID=UPI002399EFF5|nr:Sirtuin family [Penicillium coprophilum]KAJ5158745.1 Sirtuin family [Penicillium coprophilum]
MGDFDFDSSSDISDLSSAPSSPRLESSPEPAERYPTPSSQEGAESADGSAPPVRPAKRRRNPLPKDRTTQYLDLSKSLYEQNDQHYLLVQTLRHQKDIVVIAGAGISTAAGIPDFRSTDGLFKSLQKKHNLKASGKLLFDAAVYQDDALTAPFHEMVRSLSEEVANIKPTAFHQMLARLGIESRLKRLYTQNIDGIETSMGPLATEVPLSVKGSWPVTIQLHGSIEKMVCQKCRYLANFDPDMFMKADPPDCTECAEIDVARQAVGQRSHGIGRMRPRIVLYNEHNPDEEAITSVMNADIKSRPRVLIVAGTSLKIPGVRRLVKSLCTMIRSRKDGVTMFINNEPPSGKEFDNCFDLIVKGSCDEVARQANLKPWDSEDITPRVYESSPEPIPHSYSDVSVVVTPKKRPRADTGLVTPSASQDEKPTKRPATKVSKIKLENPASNGRTIKDVISGKLNGKPAARKPTTTKFITKPAPNPRTKKAATTASKKRVPVKKNATITSYSGRVTKTSQSAGKVNTKVDLKAMQPVPAGAPRNNGTLPIRSGQSEKTDVVLDSKSRPRPVASS